MARPTDYSPEMADAICAQIADGRSLRSICRDEGTPDKATVLRWLAQHPEFRDQYAHAREAQADALFDEVLEIADDSSRDWLQTDQGPQLDQEHVQRAKVRIDARKWMAARLSPKKYGDRIEQVGEITHRYVARIPEPQPDADAWLQQYASLKHVSNGG